VVFDHLQAIPQRELLDVTIDFYITREKGFVVTGDRD
jgi:hypothetical protein